MKIINITKSTILADNAKIAESLFSRMKGLLGRKSLLNNEALIIKNCNSIHTFFMQFPIDVLFVNKDNKIVAIKKAIPAFRFTPIYFSASFVIEFPAGTIEKTQTQSGDTLEIKK